MNAESKIDVFICGRYEPCHKCRLKARHECGVAGCGRKLCITHARKIGDEYRCATHAPMLVNPNMPKPIGRP